MRKQIGPLLVAAALGAIALAVVTPGVQSNSHPRIRLKTVFRKEDVPIGQTIMIQVACPRGYHVISDSGGPAPLSFGATHPTAQMLVSMKSSSRTVFGAFVNSTGSGQTAGLQAICAKGIAGLRISG
jgi:hypothetical protein